MRLSTRRSSGAARSSGPDTPARAIDEARPKVEDGGGAGCVDAIGHGYDAAPDRPVEGLTYSEVVHISPAGPAELTARRPKQHIYCAYL